MTKTRGEGDQLLALLEEHDVKQARLAREMSRSSTSISRYVDALNAGTLGDETWADIVQALRRLGIQNGEAIRPVVSHVTSMRDELLPIAALFTTRDQVEGVLAILDGSREAQAVLRVYLAGRLAEMH